MDDIRLRYGESLSLPLDAGDPLAATADIYIGKPGETYTLTKHITLTEGRGRFDFFNEETKIPKDTYYYQVNVYDIDGSVEKYPSITENCNDCEDKFPRFIVGEALDETEVS